MYSRGTWIQYRNVGEIDHNATSTAKTPRVVPATCGTEENRPPAPVAGRREDTAGGAVTSAGMTTTLAVRPGADRENDESDAVKVGAAAVPTFVVTAKHPVRFCCGR